MILLLDNFDSFTYNLVDYFNQLGVAVKVFRNDSPLEEISEYDYDGVVLSPGPEKPATAGNLLKVVELYMGQLPVLGICLGYQALGQYMGAELVKADYPMHGKISRISVEEGILFSDMPQELDVVRYHSLVLQDLPNALKPNAFTKDGVLMAFESRELKLAGMQFHPEAVLTERGLQMLKNWASFYNIV